MKKYSDIEERVPGFQELIDRLAPVIRPDDLLRLGQLEKDLRTLLADKAFENIEEKIYAVLRLQPLGEDVETARECARVLSQ